MKPVKLGLIAEVSSGQGAPQGDDCYGDNGLPFIKAGNLEDLMTMGDEYKSCKLVSKEIAKKHKLKTYPKNTLVFAKSGMSATKNRIHCLNNEAYVVNHLATIIPNPKIVDSRYLRYFFYSYSPSHLIKDDAYPSISLGSIKNIEISLPSLADQKRIVRILDEADALRQKRKLAIEYLDDYVNSVFYNSFVLNFKKTNIPLVKLGELSTRITDGVHAKPKYTESGVPFISVKNITTTRLKFEKCMFVSMIDHRSFTKRCKAELNDILYTKVGATYGRACVVDTTDEFSLYVSVALIKPKKDLINPIYLKAVLNSSYVKRQADKSVKGAGVPDLHLIEINKFKIPLPSMEEQERFSELVLATDSLKQIMYSQSEELDLQFQALMQKAFKAER